MRRALVCLLLIACTPAGETPIYTSFAAHEIGGPCTSDGDCHAGTCFTDSFAGSTQSAPGGFCTKTCTSNADCGGKNVCATYGGSTTGFCDPFCDGPTHCRSGYACSAQGFCDLESLYVLNCDPLANAGACIDPNNKSGGCIRQLLGEGTVGQCFLGCTLGGSCPTGDGCHYYLVKLRGGAWANDPFDGLLCFTNTTTTPLVNGDDCTTNADCATGLNCVDFTDGSQLCEQICSPDEPTCDAVGDSCMPFAVPGNFDVCIPSGN